ncbi:hypothetical protein SCLCIDRAFT_1211905 [Scleroderma citrinum Foug A]|uniref:Uncharacterized protein n=1 Tax=Scleroderma citrinum Foug A TaxID=1036808 RepID=A0A0C3ED95_9AGAM|nr:hypothetical protein SCLCIDRAFT_1211905 [Scleroderma citrinum Foug A]
MHPVGLVEAEVSEFHRNRTESDVCTDNIPPARVGILGSPKQLETGYRWYSEPPTSID